MTRPIPVFRFAACAILAVLIAHSVAAAHNPEPASNLKSVENSDLAYAPPENAFSVDTELAPATLSPLAAAIQNARRLRAKVGGKEQWVNLDTHVPVHLTYFTARVEVDGSLSRITDIYGYDTKLRRIMGI